MWPILAFGDGQTKSLSAPRRRLPISSSARCKKHRRCLRMRFITREHDVGAEILAALDPAPAPAEDFSARSCTGFKDKADRHERQRLALPPLVSVEADPVVDGVAQHFEVGEVVEPFPPLRLWSDVLDDLSRLELMERLPQDSSDFSCVSACATAPPFAIRRWPSLVTSTFPMAVFQRVTRARRCRAVELCRSACHGNMRRNDRCLA